MKAHDIVLYGWFILIALFWLIDWFLWEPYIKRLEQSEKPKQLWWQLEFSFSGFPMIFIHPIIFLIYAFLDKYNI